MINRLFRSYSLGAVLVIFFASGFSLWQGIYSVDPHHWGLMLSNSKDLVDGLAPYRDIAIGYGILTPLIQGILFELTSQTIFSIQVATIACYGLGLWFLFRLAIVATQDTRLSFYILCNCVLIHPAVIYPWPNYTAFPFLMGGIFYSTKSSPTKTENFIGGLLFSFATLARLEYFILAIAAFFIIPSIDLFIKRITWRKGITQLLFLFCGFIFPLCVFAIYLVHNDLVAYWFGLSWTLPFVATPQLFTHMHGLKIFDSFIRTGIGEFSQLNLRYIIIYLMLLVNIIYFFVRIVKRSNFSNQTILLKISILSLLLVGQLLHLPEIFRMATGSIIGLIPVYVLLNKVRLDRIFFFSTSVILLFVLPPTTVSSGNYFAPSKTTISAAEMVRQPAIFKYQLWPKPVSDYYNELSNDMALIKGLHCGVKYHFNHTLDVFLHIVSPFRKYQVLPFDNPQMHPAFKTIRPDLLTIEEKQKDLDVMIMQLIPNEDASAFAAPTGYFIYKQYLTPSMVFIPVNHTLMLMVPETCRARTVR